MAKSGDYDGMPSLERFDELVLPPAWGSTAAIPSLLNIQGTPKPKPLSCQHDPDCDKEQSTSPQSNRVALPDGTLLPNCLHPQDDTPPRSHSDQPGPTDRAAKVPQPSTSGQMPDEHYTKTAAADKDEWHSPAINEDMERLEEFPPQGSTYYMAESRPGEKHLLIHAAQSGTQNENTGGQPKRWTAGELAALALAADNGGWLIFDPYGEPRKVQSEAEEFLSKYVPSKVKEVNGRPVSWISVEAPTDDDDEYDDETEEDKCSTDVDGLQKAWSDLQESDQHITYQKIKELAVAHRCLSGKWMIMKKSGPNTDWTWERVFRATIAGQLGQSAKVSSALGKGENHDRHVICVYNRDFTDGADVRELERRLRQQGILCEMTYKPDVFSYMGVYRGNKWRLRPIIYRSVFDIRKKCSTVEFVYEEE